MSDLISRQAAIDAIMDELRRVSTNAIRVKSRIEALPSVQPERKKGKWIPQDFNKSDGMITTAVYYYPKCSVCGWSANNTNFCPNCGADMRGEGEQDE